MHPLHILPPVIRLGRIEDTLQQHGALMVSMVAEAKRVSALHKQTLAMLAGQSHQHTVRPDTAAAPPVPIPVFLPAFLTSRSEPRIGDSEHLAGDPQSRESRDFLTYCRGFSVSNPAPQKLSRWCSLLHTSPSELVFGEQRSGRARRPYAHRSRCLLRSYVRFLVTAPLYPPWRMSCLPYTRASAA